MLGSSEVNRVRRSSLKSSEKIALVLGDVFGIELKDINGDPLKSSILTTIQVDQLNTSAQNVIGTNQTSVVTDPITAAAGIAWELFLLMTGTYIFQILKVKNHYLKQKCIEHATI